MSLRTCCNSPIAPACCLQIMALSMMKDEERLDLLKEIGGSKVYEDRRKESLKVIQDADGRTQQIAELVTSKCFIDFTGSALEKISQRCAALKWLHHWVYNLKAS